MLFPACVGQLPGTSSRCTAKTCFRFSGTCFALCTPPEAIVASPGATLKQNKKHSGGVAVAFGQGCSAVSPPQKDKNRWERRQRTGHSCWTRHRRWLQSVVVFFIVTAWGCCSEIRCSAHNACLLGRPPFLPRRAQICHCGWWWRRKKRRRGRN